MKKLTKEQMIEKLIDNQIEKGITSKEYRDYQIKIRLSYSKEYVEDWYKEVFGKEGKERQYSATTSPEICKTKIKDLNELNVAKKYFEAIINDRTLPFIERQRALDTIDNLRVGYLCKHPVESNISYLPQEAPHFMDRDDYRFSTLPVKIEKAINDDEKARFTSNKGKFVAFLPLVEKALLNNRLFKYEAKVKNVESFLEIQKESFAPRERIDLGFVVANEKRFHTNIEKISKIEYIESLIKNVEAGKLSSFEVSELNKYKKEIEINTIEEKIQSTEKRLDNLANKKIEIIASCSLEEYKNYKENVEFETKKIEMLKIEKEKILEKYESTAELKSEKDDEFNESFERLY